MANKKTDLKAASISMYDILLLYITRSAYVFEVPKEGQQK